MCNAIFEIVINTVKRSIIKEAISNNLRIIIRSMYDCVTHDAHNNFDGLKTLLFIASPRRSTLKLSLDHVDSFLTTFVNSSN